MGRQRRRDRISSIDRAVPAANRDPASGDRASSSKIGFDANDAELARAALLAELDFAWSLIRTYREFQMQAVGFSVALYAAVLGLIGSAINSERFLAVASYCTALLPLPAAMLVLVFAVMEVRIRRASRHNQRTIAPKLEALRQVISLPPLLEWEINPSRWLSEFERRMASSAVFVIAMSLPALAGAAWHLFARDIPVRDWHPITAGIAAVCLICASVVASVLSIGHESRRG